jgi:hypothetical protein
MELTLKERQKLTRLTDRNYQAARRPKNLQQYIMVYMSGNNPESAASPIHTFAGIPQQDRSRLYLLWAACSLSEGQSRLKSAPPAIPRAARDAPNSFDLSLLLG